MRIILLIVEDILYYTWPVCVIHNSQIILISVSCIRDCDYRVNNNNYY